MEAHLVSRGIATNGRITNEDRRWWLIHLECAPDITPGTFVSWLDCCGTHTTKKLIERNIWTIEQVSELDSDEVDELKYKEGCLKMDITWEHARTIITPLRHRMKGTGVESEFQNRILELRKKRELERKREEIIQERSVISDRRNEMLQKLRETIASKKAELRKKMEEQQASAQAAISSDTGLTTDEENIQEDSVSAATDRMRTVIEGDRLDDH
ncbi:unnamed protein product [Phytomonas sp. Hart1]|nr:unnamed protein product [Phytomonas sp. Hart1]|eukprot:CCW71277.1 unnamed protein product [Phytomonas sp. isolate Hart1]